MEEAARTIAGTAVLLGDLPLWLIVIAGTVYGVIIGALPGVGTTLGYAVVLPLTFAMGPVNAVAFLLAIAVGNQYGNSIPAIVIGVPGSSTAILTVLDGYALHKAGQTGLALGVAYVAALLGQIIAIPFFVLAVIPLAALTYVFLSPELFALYLLGLVTIISLTGSSVIKGLAAGAIGFLIGFVGQDPVQFQPRFDFGLYPLRHGFDVGAVVIGLLAVSELFRQSRQVFNWNAQISGFKLRFPGLSSMKSTWRALFGGTIIGTFVAAIPGAGGTTGAMIAYQQARLWSKNPRLFGKGSIEGIAANEAAQNASNAGEMIPTLGLGIPASASQVILLGALSYHGLVAGPSLTRETPELLDAAVAGMVMGTVVLAVTGWWMCRAMVRLALINRSLVIVTCLGLVLVGTFALRGTVVDTFVAVAFGIVGYFMLRFGYPTAPAALAVVLAPGLEETFRRGMALFDNDVIAFGSRPITAFLIVLSIAVLGYGIISEIRTRRQPLAGADGLTVRVGPDG